MCPPLLGGPVKSRLKPDTTYYEHMKTAAGTAKVEKLSPEPMEHRRSVLEQLQPRLGRTQGGADDIVRSPGIARIDRRIATLRICCLPADCTRGRRPGGRSTGRHHRPDYGRDRRGPARRHGHCDRSRPAGSFGHDGDRRAGRLSTEPVADRDVHRHLRALGLPERPPRGCAVDGRVHRSIGSGDERGRGVGDDHGFRRLAARGHDTNRHDHGTDARAGRRASNQP